AIGTSRMARLLARLFGPTAHSANPAGFSTSSARQYLHRATCARNGGFAMLFFGRQRARTCQGLTRRAFLQVGGSTVLGLTLADRLRAGAPSAGSAKSVILLWLWGGPSQLDTFDPKPNAPMEYRGPFSPIATKTVGLRVSELFPQVAQLSDKFALIR